LSTSFVIAEQTRINYAGLFLLKHMDSEQVDYLVALKNDEKVIEPVFSWLLERGYVEVTDRDCYGTTSKGQLILEDYDQRYQSFLNESDVFCAVDLETGEFAFSQYHDYSSPEDWSEYLAQDRWEDLRLAVAEFQQIDPVEVVFMTLVRDERFGFDEDGWKFELLLGSIWDEIASICSTGLRLKSLGYVDGNEIVSAEKVMQDIFSQGQAVLLELK